LSIEYSQETERASIRTMSIRAGDVANVSRNVTRKFPPYVTVGREARKRLK